MPRDLLAGPRDLLAEAEPPQPTIAAKVGDWVVDNLMANVSADMRENARTGDFARDATINDGFLDRAGSLIERGGASVDRGIYRFLGGLGSKRGQEEAANLERGTLAKPVAGETQWKDAKGLGGLGKFIASAGIESVPSMAALAVPYLGPLVVGTSQTGNIAADRAANNNTAEVTGDDLLSAAPWAIGSTALDLLGLKGITKPMGGSIPGRIAGATAREGLTEAAQSGLEYTGGAVGTEKGFKPKDLLDDMVQGGVAGAGVGGAVRTGIEAAAPVSSRLVKTRPEQPAGRSEAVPQDDYDGSLDDLLAPEQAKPRDLLALPSPEMVRKAEAAKPQSLDATIDNYMARTRKAESGGNDKAANTRSSADGRYQFTDATWKQYHRKVYGDDGLSDKFNPAKQERLMREFTRDNAAALQRAGIPVDEGTLYQAHHFGSAGAIEMHRNSGAAVDPDVVKANPQFRGMTNGQALAWAQRHHGGSGGSVAPDAGIPDAPDVAGADGSLLGRGERQERIAKIEIPEGKAAAVPITPVKIEQAEAIARGVPVGVSGDGTHTSGFYKYDGPDGVFTWNPTQGIANGAFPKRSDVTPADVMNYLGTAPVSVPSALPSPAANIDTAPSSPLPEIAPTEGATPAPQTVLAPEKQGAPASPAFSAPEFTDRRPLDDNRTGPLSRHSPRYWRETSLDELELFLPNGGASNLVRTTGDLYFADRPELALGQGSNRGVTMEFDAGDLQGRVDTTKPTAALGYGSGSGSEYVARYNNAALYKSALRSFRIATDAKARPAIRMRMSPILRGLEKAGWKRTDGDGFVQFDRPDVAAPTQRDLLALPKGDKPSPDVEPDRPSGQPAATRPDSRKSDGGSRRAVPTLARGQLRALGIAAELRTEKAAALVGRTASTPRELAEIAQVYRDPRYETFRIFLTKGDTIVHATGVSMRSVNSAPLMPDGMSQPEFRDSTIQTMKDLGADGYYLLHNHPSGDPSPSMADMDVTRRLAKHIPGFRAHVVINSNKYAEIAPNENGVNVSKLHEIGAGPDALLTASIPHEILGRKIELTSELVALGKGLQKPGWITVIGTGTRGAVRVIVEYPASTAKRDAKALMAMARRIQRQSGSARLFLIGDRKVLDTPVVRRALSGDVITAAIDEDGAPIKGTQRHKRNQMPSPPARKVAEVEEHAEPFSTSDDGADDLVGKLVDKDGLTRDAQAIKDIIGNPAKTLTKLMKSGLADNARAAFYSTDARLRYMAKRYSSEAINDLADVFHARAGVVDKAVDETYHEAVEREGFGRAGKVWRVLEPFAGDKAAMDRIGTMLRNPGERGRYRRAEAEAAAKIAKLLKETLDYRKAAGEDIGEVTDGYFPRWLDVEKAVANRDLFRRQATELYRRHGSENPEASADAWLARLFDQYAGLDGGLDHISLFHDTRPAGVGRKTTKSREFGKDADTLLKDFYDNDTGSVLTAYMMGAARKAEEARRFGPSSTGQHQMRQMMNRIKADIRKSGEDAGDTLDAIARIVSSNLGRTRTIGERMRATTSVLHTASQLGTLDRATITSLSESMMGFVRAGPRYGTQMIIDSGREFARQLRKAPPSEAARMAEALGIATDALVGEALAARAGFERAHTTQQAQKVQQGFFKATGLHQWTEATRAAATRLGQVYLGDMAIKGGKRSAEYLTELGVKDPAAFSKWLRESGAPSPEQLISPDAGEMERQYRTALMRFAGQTIMKPGRAQKPRWASDPVYSLGFALLSFSYGFKKNVLDRTGRMAVRGIKEGDPTLLYPAFGLAGLLVAHTAIQTVREAAMGGGREDDEEGFELIDLMEAMDRAGLFGAASPLINAVWGLKYRRGTMESLVGPTIGRPFDLIDKTVGLGTGTNSPKTNTAERAAAGAVYDIVLEPALEAYGVTRLKGPLAVGTVWGTGNREGGALPADRDAFIEAVAGPKKE